MKKKGLKSRPLVRKTTREYCPPREKRPKGAVFRWGFALFVAVWMFVLGIIVGRYATPVDFDPLRIEKELAELRAAEIQKEKDRLKAEAKALYDMDLDFYQDLARTGGSRADFHTPELLESGLSEMNEAAHLPPATPEMKRSLSTKSSIPARPEKQIISPPPEKTKTIAIPPPVPKQALPRPSAADAPESVPASSDLTAPGPRKTAGPVDTAGGFAIQVASFVAASDADRTVAMLKRRGYADAYRTEDSVPGMGTRYRVRIGRFNDPDAARGILSRLKGAERFQDAYILKNR